MTTRRWLAAVAAWGVALFATPAAAQSPAPEAEDWSRGTTLAGFAGVLVDGATADPVTGAALGWEIAPHLSVEGQGAWVRMGDGAGAFAGQIRARVPLRRHQPLVPYAVGGIGVYRATFDGGAAVGHQFYRRRTGARAPAGGAVFDDFMAVAGGGVDLFLTRRLALRPEVTALIVTDSGDARVVPLATVQLVYHFTTQPVTERRRR